jgi:hypothetical protein
VKKLKKNFYDCFICGNKECGNRVKYRDNELNISQIIEKHENREMEWTFERGFWSNSFEKYHLFCLDCLEIHKNEKMKKK